MPYQRWYARVEKKVAHVKEHHLAWRAGFFSLALFLGVFWYIEITTPFGTLNKAAADTAVILMGLSMLLSSLCYFWNFVDTKIVYRKHLGLAGFAFAVVHLLLSWSAFTNMLKLETWAAGKAYPAFAGTLGFLIFTVMALISNNYSATTLGGRVWRGILRLGYPALLLVAIHVILLKHSRWQTWAAEGFKTLPSMSLLMTMFIIVVLAMRVALELSLRKQRRLTGQA